MIYGLSIQNRLLALLVGLTFGTTLAVIVLIVSTGRDFILRQTVRTYSEEHQVIAQALDNRLSTAATITHLLASTLDREPQLPFDLVWRASGSSMSSIEGLIERVTIYAPLREAYQVITFEQPETSDENAPFTRLTDQELTTAEQAALDQPGLVWWQPADEPVLTLSAAYHDFEEQPVGLVRVDLPVAGVQSVLAELVSSHTQSRHSYSLLVDAAHRPLVLSPVNDDIDPAAQTQLLDWVQNNPSATFIDQFAGWNSALVTRSNLPQTGWTLLVAVPGDMIYNPVNDNLLQVVLVLAVGLVSTYVLARGVIKRRIITPLNDLTNAAQEIGSGEMRYLIGYQNQPDEMGKLAKALDYMKTNLMFSYDELARWSRTLEQRVNQRTHELAQAQEKAQTTAAELQAVYDASIALVNDYQLNTILHNLTQRIASLLTADYVAVWLLNTERTHMQLIASTLEDHSRLNLILPADQGLAGITMRDGQPIIMEDYAHWPGRLQINSGIEQALCVPLMFFNKPIGAVLAGRNQSTPIFNLNDQRLLTLLANLVSPMVRNAQLYARLGEAMRETKQANEVKTRFLASVTHELRTPLNLIINNMDFMRIGEFGPVNDEQIMRLSQTIRSAEHLLYLINDLLDVSKIEAGEMQLFIQLSDPYPMLEDALDSAVALLDEGHSVALHADIPEDLPHIPMDARRIRQVVTNLLSNAIKFTTAGDVSITVRTTETMIEFSIQDTGMGIPDEELDKLFKMFERTNRARQLGIEGTGLGLPISRYLVEAHGGEMWVTTEVGHGSTFTFNLPRQQTGDETGVKRVTATLESMEL